MTKKSKESNAQITEVQGLIIECNDRYQEAFLKAIESSELTNQPKFQKIVADFRNRVMFERNDISESLERLSQTARENGLNEDCEKELGELKKQSVSLRERHTGFYNSVIAPIRDTVSRCESLLAEFTSSASGKDQEFPLQSRGIYSKSMAAEIATWPKASWDEVNAKVVISYPPTDEIETVGVPDQ